jgi:WD40 repeat protein
MKADLVLELKADAGIAFDEAWSPAGDLLVVAGLDEALYVWDVGSGKRVLSVPHPQLLSCVDWCSDGRRLVSGSSAGEILVFEASSGAIAARVTGHTDEVCSVAFSPDGRYVASGANDGTVRIWSSTDLSPVGVTPASASLVRSVAWSSDSGSVASGGADGVLRVWDARTGKAMGALADHRSFIAEVAYSSDGRLLASASSDSTVRIWDLSARAYAAILDGFDGWWVEGMSFSPDGQDLATIDQNGTIRIWHLGSQQVVLTLQAGGLSKTVSWSPDGCHIASGGPTSELVWAVEQLGQRERKTADTADSRSEGWHPNPDGAHQFRYHDGTDWTVHVADNGTMSQAPRVAAQGTGGAGAAGRPVDAESESGSGGPRAPQLAQEYGRACSAVMAAAQATLAVADKAAGAWNMAQQRPQHEISIQTFTRFAQSKEAEFAPLFHAFQAAVDAARAAGAKLSSQFSDPDDAEVCLAVVLDDQAYSDVGAAIQFLRADAPSDARGFHDLVPRINHLIQTTPAYGEPGFPSARTR